MVVALLETLLLLELTGASANDQAINGNCLLQHGAVVGQQRRRRRSSATADIVKLLDQHEQTQHSLLKSDRPLVAPEHGFAAVHGQQRRRRRRGVAAEVAKQLDENEKDHSFQKPHNLLVVSNQELAGADTGDPHPGTTKLHGYSQVFGDLHREWAAFTQEHPDLKKSLQGVVHSHYLISASLDDLPKFDDAEYRALASKSSGYLDLLRSDSHTFMHKYNSSANVVRWWYGGYFSSLATQIRAEAEHVLVDLKLLRSYSQQKIIATNFAHQKHSSTKASQSIISSLHSEMKKQREKSTADMQRAFQSVVKKDIFQREGSLAARINETIGSILHKEVGGNFTNMLKTLLHGEVDAKTIDNMSARMANVELLLRSDFAVGVITSVVVFVMLLWLDRKSVV